VADKLFLALNHRCLKKNASEAIAIPADAIRAAAVIDIDAPSFPPALKSPKKSEPLSISSASFTFSFDRPRFGSAAVRRIDSITSALSPTFG